MSQLGEVVIDGSRGEGGGQMLRSSLSLSLVTQKPFRMVNIRAGREKPGLLRQHLAATLAAAEVGQAQVEGAELGSQTLSFAPTTIKPGEYRFVIGTAGSGPLVFQTVLPALMTASGPSRITIEGGTHNISAPPFDYLDRCYLPFLNRMGPKVQLQLDRYGFYPAGGGCFHAFIEPAATLSPLEIDARGPIQCQRALALLANLPHHIGDRELATVREMLGDEVETRAVATKLSAGPGNVLMLELVSEHGTEMFTSFGQIGVTAEDVARQAVREASEYLLCEAVAGEHLTDQLLLPFALAGAGSFSAQTLTRHALTNMEVIGMFLPVRFHTIRAQRYVSIQIQKL